MSSKSIDQLLEASLNYLRGALEAQKQQQLHRWKRCIQAMQAADRLLEVRGVSPSAPW